MNLKETEEPAKPTTPAPSTSASATPIKTSNESGNTYRGNRRGSSRRGNKGGTRGSEQKDFKGETPELNFVLGLITERLDQGVTFEKFQGVLKKYVLKNFHKVEDISRRGIVVRAKYFSISYAWGHRFRTAVSKA